MLTIYIIGLVIVALLSGFDGTDRGTTVYVSVILWPILGLILIGALLRDLADTIRYHWRNR